MILTRGDCGDGGGGGGGFTALRARPVWKPSCHPEVSVTQPSVAQTSWLLLTSVVVVVLAPVLERCSFSGSQAAGLLR